MSTIKEFLIRVEAYAAISEQSVSTLSRKLLNDGKGIARLRGWWAMHSQNFEYRSYSARKLRARVTRKRRCKYDSFRALGG